MDYDKMMYFPKTEMSHLSAALQSHQISSATFLSPPDAYASYADSFDLSLLPSDCDLPSSPESNISTTTSSSSTPSSSSHSPNVSLDYIPTTIFHDPVLRASPVELLGATSHIKIEQLWGREDSPSASPIQQNHSILYEQLQKKPQTAHPPHYRQIYPSPQSSPLQTDHHQFNLLGTTTTGGAIGTVYPPSPCPSIENFTANTPITIKQELHILPPSPPESNCEAPSPHSFADIKSEPLDADVETLIDINSLLEKSLKDLDKSSKVAFKKEQPAAATQHQQDHQLLREYLEDTSFQKKHNLKPLALESLIGGLGVRGDIEPVISLALEYAKREAEETCAKLQISRDPQNWSPSQVHAWLRSTVQQFQLPSIIDLEMKFSEDGTTLSLLTEEEFIQRAPEAGATIHAQLEIWKLAYSDNFNEITTNHHIFQAADVQDSNVWKSNCMQSIDMDVNESEDEDQEMSPPAGAEMCTTQPLSISPANGSSASAIIAPTTLVVSATQKSVTAPSGRTGTSHIHLWQFLKELLATPHVNGTAIRWIDRSKGVFKIEDSVRVAKLWGRRKNRPAMNYDKLSRSIRQYYKKGIMKKTERSQRLVYQFCHPYCL